MAIQVGVNISKLLGYSVLGLPAGVSVSKLQGYSILGLVRGVNVSKLQGYSILGTVVAPVWSGFTFPDGVVGTPYYQDWDLSPATPPTTYTVTAGALPPGLSLTNISQDLGKIDGTPTTPGTYTFTLTATNAFGTVDKSCSIFIGVGAGGASSGAVFF
jgi:hypothetical protein